MNTYSIIFSSLSILVGVGSIIANLCIASRTISTNKEIAKENAGKNRVIYSIEEVEIDASDSKRKIGLDKKLSSGDYTILTTYTFPGNQNLRVYSLGKIKP